MGAVVGLIELRRLEKVLVGLQKHFQGRKRPVVQAGGCEEKENLGGVCQASEGAKGEVSAGTSLT